MNLSAVNISLRRYLKLLTWVCPINQAKEERRVVERREALLVQCLTYRPPLAGLLPGNIWYVRDRGLIALEREVTCATINMRL